MSQDPTFRVLGQTPTRSERYEAYRKEWDFAISSGFSTRPWKEVTGK